MGRQLDAFVVLVDEEEGRVVFNCKKTARDSRPAAAGAPVVQQHSLQASRVGWLLFGWSVGSALTPTRHSVCCMLTAATPNCPIRRAPLTNAANAPHPDKQAGRLLDGTVHGVEDYGAFVDLGEHGRGLIHISQISHARVKDASEVFSAGDEVKVLVLPPKPKHPERISLSTKALEREPGDMLEDPESLVYPFAEETAAAWRAKHAEKVAEQLAEEEAEAAAKAAAAAVEAAAAQRQRLGLPPRRRKAVAGGRPNGGVAVGGSSVGGGGGSGSSSGGGQVNRGVGGGTRKRLFD